MEIQQTVAASHQQRRPRNGGSCGIGSVHTGVRLPHNNVAGSSPAALIHTDALTNSQNKHSTLAGTQQIGWAKLNILQPEIAKSLPPAS
jgi:hypothetical protein